MSTFKRLSEESAPLGREMTAGCECGHQVTVQMEPVGSEAETNRALNEYVDSEMVRHKLTECTLETQKNLVLMRVTVLLARLEIEKKLAELGEALCKRVQAEKTEKIEKTDNRPVN